MESSWDSKKRVAPGKNHQALTTSMHGHEGAMNEEIEDLCTGEVAFEGNKFSTDHSKNGRAKCKECSKLIAKGDIRIGKLVPFKDTHIHRFYHLVCAFESFKRARLLPNVISKSCEVDGVDILTEAEKAMLEKLIAELNARRKNPLRVE